MTVKHLFGSIIIAAFCLICGCKQNSAAIPAKATAEAKVVQAEKTPLISASLPETVEPYIPRIAVYPLIPLPDSVSQPGIDAALEQAQHELESLFSEDASLILLDRSGISDEAISPERQSLAWHKPADYVITGGLERESEDSKVFLELTHVRTGELISTLEVHTATRPINHDDTKLHILADIEQHQSRLSGDQEDRFNVAIAGFFPTETSQKNFKITQSLHNTVINKLLEQQRYALVSGSYAHAIYLESLRARFSEDRIQENVVVHGRLLDTDHEREGYHLLLYIERVGGLHKVLPLQAKDPDTLSRAVAEEINDQLKYNKTYLTNEVVDEQIATAWRLFFKNGKPFVNGFPGKVTSKNKEKIAHFKTQIDSTLAISPDHPDALVGIALYENLMKNHNKAYEVIERLLWDPRTQALELGQQALNRKIGYGTTFYTAGSFAGLSGYATEKQAVDELLDNSWLEEDNDKYWWKSHRSLLRYPYTDNELWPSMLGIRNTNAETLARYRLLQASGSMATEHPSRKLDVITGQSHIQSIYYALANSVAPIYLTIGKNGFYSQLTELEFGRQVGASELYNHQNLIGRAALAKGTSIEPDLIYASVTCGYYEANCNASQKIYSAIANHENEYKTALLVKNINRERTTLYADNLIDMAKRKSKKLRELHGVVMPDLPEQRRSSPEPVTVTIDIPLDIVDSDVFEACVDCPEMTNRRRVHSDSNGKILALAESNFDTPGQYQPNSQIKSWMFSNEFIDISGNKLHKRLPKGAEKDLRQAFPTLTDAETNEIVNQYYKSTFKQSDAGRVLVFQTNKAEPIALKSPDVRPEQKFGTKIAVGSEKILVCDQWGEGFQFVQSSVGWNYDRKENQFCGDARLAFVGNWLIKARRNQVSFYIDDHQKYNLKQLAEINKDFKKIGDSYTIRDVKASGQYLIVDVVSSNKYHFLVYKLKQNDWHPVSIAELPGYFLDFEIHNNHVYQLTSDQLVVYSLQNDKLSLVNRYQVAQNGKSSNIGELLLLNENNEVKLVIAARDQVLAYAP